MDYSNDKLAHRLWWLTAGLLVLGFFLNLGVQPFLLEEPRRIIIAFEMLENGNWWVPTEFGDYYYSKPPLFNWLLIGSARVLGGFSAFAMRVPTVLSVLGLGWLCFWVGRRYVDVRFGALGALLFLTTGGILFYFSTLAEIDLFYSLVTFGSFVAFFHFYQQQRLWLMFFLTYMLGMVGIMTKGPTSVLYLGFTIVGYLAWKRDWKALFSAAHIVNGLLCLLFVGAYLYVYHQYHPLTELLNGLWGQSKEMTVLEQAPNKLLRHVLIFPFDVWKDLLPGALLLVFLLRRGVPAQIRQHELLLFSLLVFVVNIPVYWFSPGGRTRYIYMLYPFLCFLFLWFYLRYKESGDWRHVFFRASVGLLIGAAALAALGINFVPALDFLPYRLWWSLLFFAAFVAVGYLYWRRPGLTLTTLLLATAIARCLFDVTVLPQRAHDSDGQRARVIAQEMLDIAGEKPIYVLYRSTLVPHNIALQVKYLRGQTLRRSREFEPDTYYWVNLDTLSAKGHSYKVYLEMDHDGEPHGVVRQE